MTDQIHTLATRVEHLEERMEKHSTKIETKLDALVELMQKVTQLQEREARNADDIHDIRGAIKGLIVAQEAMNHRWHERMDKNMQELEQYKNLSASNMKQEIEKNRESIIETDKTLNRWLNRAAGGWTVAAVLLIVIQGIGVWAIKDALAKIENNSNKIVQIEKTIK